MARIGSPLSYLFTGILAALNLVTFRCDAQFSEVGIKLGPSLTTLHSAFETDRPIVSMVVGIYAPLKINQRLLFQPEFELAFMGADREIDSEHSARLRTFYARVPLTLRYCVTSRLQLGVGFQAGYLVMASQIADAEMTDVHKALNPLDLGLIGGMSILLGQSTDLSLRYVYGMSAIFREDTLLFPSNRAVQLTLGVRIARMKGKSGWRRRNIAPKG